MKPEIFNNPLSPILFSSREAAVESKNLINEEGMALGELELEKFKYIEVLLNHPELDGLIDEGKITLGLIKPHAHQGRDLPSDDEAAAEVLVDEIGRENIVFSLNILFSENDVDLFYGSLKEDYSRIVNQDGVTVWDSIYRFAQSGPLTMMLIYKEEGEAVSWWRNRMGKTRPNEAEPDSIRGRYAIQDNLPNNLTHGSDSIESVKKEIEVFSEIVSNIVSTSLENARKVPSEDKLKTLGVIEKNESMVGVRRIIDSGMRDESWIYVYEVQSINEKGRLIKRYVQEKNIISMGGGHSERAKEQEERMDFLILEGMPTPKKYGVIGPTIYTEYVQGETANKVLESIGKNMREDSEFIEYLDQLIVIAQILDRNGFTSINFLGDLIFDPRKKEFQYVDFGSDLGSGRGLPENNSLKTLLEKFPSMKSYIIDKYNEVLDK